MNNFITLGRRIINLGHVSHFEEGYDCVEVVVLGATINQKIDLPLAKVERIINDHHRKQMKSPLPNRQGMKVLASIVIALVTILFFMWGSLAQAQTPNPMTDLMWPDASEVLVLCSPERQLLLSTSRGLAPHWDELDEHGQKTGRTCIGIFDNSSQVIVQMVNDLLYALNLFTWDVFKHKQSHQVTDTQVNVGGLRHYVQIEDREREDEFEWLDNLVKFWDTDDTTEPWWE